MKNLGILKWGLAGILTAGAGCSQQNESVNVCSQIVMPYAGKVEAGWVREGNWQYKEQVSLGNNTYRKFQNLDDALGYEHMQKILTDSDYRKEAEKKYSEKGCLISSKR